MGKQLYKSGEEVRLGDVVDLGSGHGPKAIVVVLIPDGPAAEGFDTAQWAYLRTGFMLQAESMALVHSPEPDDELRLVSRA